ncbi:MAG: TRAP transporter large permease [Defluviicoccus sp.]|nr:TRAP transporter large permease [Defluviicoccus sp.]MDE0384613.1 TRAP transporter large permease [Defluviicoccus sp.]
MAWFEAGGLLMGLVVGLMLLGMPVAFAFLGVSVIGVTLYMGFETGLKQLSANATNAVTVFVLVPLPLFLLMGELFFRTGLAARVFDAFDRLFGRLPGRLSYLTVAGGTTFAALTGASMASTAMLGALMLPEMARRGYKKHLAMGPILGTGGLAMIIPPSGLAVLLGSIARIDIGKLLIAGVLPGLLLAAMYVAVIYVQVRIDPDAAPQYAVERVSLGEKLRLVATNILPMGVIVFMVIGLILLGVATPSESAAFGVLGVLILAAAFGSLTVEAVRTSLLNALKVTAMVFLIITGSATFSQILALSGASSGMVRWATGQEVAPILLLLVMFAILLFLGMLMEQVSIMMLTVPIFFPLAQALGFDLIWFGVIMLLALEISLATPPFGLGLFVLMGVAPKGTTLVEVAVAALPYVGSAILLVLILIAVPEIATLLPGLMD